MADRTSIEWTDASWTPVKGCTRASEGCRNCYAEIMAARFSGPGQWGEGLAQIVDTPQGKDHRWTGKVRFDEKELTKPLRWRTPRKVFVCSTADLFHESVPDEWIDRVFAVMALCPQHTFQVLTKRSARMREYLSHEDRLGHVFKASRAFPLPREHFVALNAWPYLRECWTWPLPNVWLGVSVEDQQRADERVPDLLDTPAAVRWLSCEPLLGPLELGCLEQGTVEQFRVDMIDCLKGGGWLFDEDGELVDIKPIPKLDWVVAGGESGPGARGSTDEVEAWMRSLRDQCQAASVPFFGKQNYHKLPLPEDLLVREFPHAR